MVRSPGLEVEHPELLERAHPFRQWKTWRMPGAGLTLTGYSRAADKTYFHVPELRCGLDAGLCEGRQVDTVFLTHTHLDHSKDLDFLASKDSGTDIYLPSGTGRIVTGTRCGVASSRSSRLIPRPSSC